MVVTVFKGARGRVSFARRDGSTRQREIAIQVPEGSEILGSILGPQLFVRIDKLVRRAWSAEELLWAARERRTEFKVVKPARV